MLSIELNHRVKYLSRKIKRARKGIHFEKELDDQLVEAKTGWCAAHFLAELIFHSQLIRKFPQKIDLDNFYNEYPNKDAISIQALQEKLWIRNVMNRIVVPGKISSLVRDSEKYNKQPLPDDASANAREYYAFLKTVEVDLTFIRNFHQHFSPYTENGFVIDSERAREIIKSHQAAFSSCPSFENFIESKFLNASDTKCRFDFKTNHGNLWDAFKDEIAGLLWTKMIAGTKARNGYAVLDNWLDIVITNTSNMYPSGCLEFMGESARKDFIELGKKRILEEPDLKESPREIEKIQLEDFHDHPRDANLTPIEVRMDSSQTIVNKFKVIEEIRGITNSNLFIHQSCRYRINILLSVLLQSEKTFMAYRREDALAAFPLTIELLKQGNSRPHLLYEIPFFIEHSRPEIIPYLLIQKELEYIGIVLLGRINVADSAVEKYEQQNNSGDSIYQFKTRLSEEALHILLAHFILHRSSDSKELISLLVSTLSQLARAAYFKPVNAGKSFSQKLIYERYGVLWKVLRHFREGTSGISDYGHEKPTFIVRQFEELTTAVCSLRMPPHHVAFFTPPLGLLDIHIQLLKSLNDPLAFNTKALLPDVIKRLKACCETLIKSMHQWYLSFFDYKDMDVKGHWLKIEKQPSRFYLNTFGIKQIDWTTYVQSLDLQQLSEFVYAVKGRFDLSGIKKAYQVSGNDKVRDLQEKYYYHLMVLTSTYVQLKNGYSSSEEALPVIEKRITEIVCNFSQTILEENRVNIFDKNLEMFGGERLFEKIIEAVASFSPQNRTKVIDAVAENVHALDKIFLSFNILTSEEDRQYLLKKIDKISISKYLEAQNWLPNIQEVLLHSIDAEELTGVAEQILQYIEPKILENGLDNFETQHLYFRIKLLLAYRKKDKAAIENLPGPKNPSSSYYSGFYYENEVLRKFYLAALLHAQGHHIEAYKEFSLLHITHPKEIQIASNKFGSAIEVAKGKDSLEAEQVELSKAWEEWSQFEKEVSEAGKDGFNTSYIQLTKLECLYLLKKYYQIDSLIGEIKKTDRYSKFFAEFIFKSKLEQNRYTEASEFVNELESFHKYRSEELPNFVVEFRREIGNEENIKRLRVAYSHIINQSPENLIKTLPSSICEQKDNLGDFFLDELLLAAKGIQSKVVGSGVKAENKLTDILQLMINARLSAWRMQWNGQERQGKTQSNKGNPASVDLSINMQHYSFPLEAVRFNKSFGSIKKNVENHILKNFDHTASRKFLYNVVYYQHSAFLDDWRKFHENFLPAVNFRTEFGLVAPVEIINWSSTTANLKACRTLHKNDVVCYYIFVDLTLFN